MARYGKKATEKVERAMHEMKRGTLRTHAPREAEEMVRSFALDAEPGIVRTFEEGRLLAAQT